VFFIIESKSDFDIIEMESDIDHIYLMLQYIPRVSISSIVNRIKSIATHRVWEKHIDYLQKYFGLMDILCVVLEKPVLRLLYETI